MFRNTKINIKKLKLNYIAKQKSTINGLKVSITVKNRDYHL